MTKDALFVRFVGGLFLVMLLYGGAAAVVTLWGSEALATKMLTAFGSMFAGVLGLGSGYLLGTRTNGNGEK